MLNEMYWLAMLLVNFGAILMAYRLFGKTGLYAWIPLSTIIANIQVLKTVELFGMVATLGNVVYATSFLVTDILSENYGKKAAARGVKIGFFSLLFSTLLMNLALVFVPHASDFAQEHLQAIFSLMPRIAAASLAAYGLSQTHDVMAYDFWKRRFPQWKFIWLRNNGSTMISQLIDSAVFCFIAFWGQFEMSVFWQIFLTTYVLKWVVAAADTPFVYLARWFKEKEWIPRQNPA